MNDVHNNFIDAIGNTPLIRLNGPSNETGCNILGKAEYLNPGGSIKDRAAWAIIKEVPKHSTMVGNPARNINKDQKIDSIFKPYGVDVNYNNIDE